MVTLTTWVNSDTKLAIEKGVPDKWKSSYDFLKKAVEEKLEREGLK